MALVDPGGDRHQLHRIDAEAHEVVEDRRLLQRAHGAAQRLGHVGVQPGERPDRHLVDEAAGPEHRRRRRLGDGEGRHHRLRHQAGGVDPVAPRGREPRIVDERPVERDGIGVDEQLRGVEAVPVRRLERPVGAKPVAGAGARVLHRDGKHPEPAPAHGDAPFALAVEKAEPHPLGVRRPDREAGAPGAGNGAERLRKRHRAQVMTSGSERPVRSPMLASVSAAAMRSASASATARPRLPSGGS